MIRAKVIGHVYATCKDRRLEGKRLLLVQPIGRKGQATGSVMVAVDTVGSGYDEEVILVRGKEAAFPFLPQEVPADLATVGIIDEVWWAEESPRTRVGRKTGSS